MSYVGKFMIRSITKRHLSKRDPVLTGIMHYIEESVIESTGDVFFDLVSCIMEQQIHYRANGLYIKKLMKLIHDQIPSPALLLSLDLYEFTKKKILNIKYKALWNLALY